MFEREEGKKTIRWFPEDEIGKKGSGIKDPTDV